MLFCVYCSVAFINSIPFENTTQFLEDLFRKEFELRNEAKAERMVKKAGFLTKKTIESFHWNEKIRFPPKLNTKELCSLGCFIHY